MCTIAKTFLFVVFGGIIGHIRPHCNKLCNRLISQRGKKNLSPQQVKTKSIWVRQSDLCYNVVLTALRAQGSHVWYLDSGCSRHMSGEKSLFTSLEKHNGGNVQFGDGSKSKVTGKGSVNIPAMLTPQNVLLVDGLKANLLSISQLCGSE